MMTSTALIIAGVIIFWSLVGYLARASKQKNEVTDTLFWSIAAGLVVARLIFVIDLWEIYQKDWLSVLNIRDGGFNSYSGWFAGLTVLLVRAKKHRQLMSFYLKSGAITAAALFPLVVIQTLYNTSPSPLNINAQTSSGEYQSLELNIGKPVVINFWASWCPPCRREMPVLARAQQTQSDVKFIFINQSEAPTKAERFLMSQGVDLENTYFDFAGNISKSFGAYGLPTTLFFNAKGELVDRHMGELSEASLQHYLRPLLK